MLVTITHVAGALLALGAGFGALGFRQGGKAHRISGKLYLLGWVLLALSGALIGLRRPGLTAFEVLNAIGFGFVVYAYAVIGLRRRIGQRWLNMHMDGMLSSMAALWVATANQLLGNLAVMFELPYPFWFFVLLCISPSFFMPRIGAWLARRNNMPAPRKGNPARPSLSSSVE